jgi:2-keto-4-pentenoate hydratase/2-oxohepta-3-ene-1,7-dioic acid hydratase in catechol pathway
VGDFLAAEGVFPAGGSMVDLIARYDSIKDSIEKAVEKGTTVRIDPKRLKAPVERPSKIWAAATNYKRGTAGLEGAAGRGHAQQLSNEEILEMAFLKPPSAVIGPEEEILIPAGANTIFPELELCVVIGKESRNLSKSRAMDAVFGYTIILDVTARGYGLNKSLTATRCVRKGFNTFAPIGPWITTKDEIKDPHDLLMRLWVNGELTQSAKTDAMINRIPELVSYLSTVGTLYPGDLIATGNPDSPEYQRQLVPGDVLKAEIEGIGAMELGVARNAS